MGNEGELLGRVCLCQCWGGAQEAQTAEESGLEPEPVGRLHGEVGRDASSGVLHGGICLPKASLGYVKQRPGGEWLLPCRGTRTCGLETENVVEVRWLQLGPSRTCHGTWWSIWVRSDSRFLAGEGPGGTALWWRCCLRATQKQSSSEPAHSPPSEETGTSDSLETYTTEQYDASSSHTASERESVLLKADKPSVPSQKNV